MRLIVVLVSLLLIGCELPYEPLYADTTYVVHDADLVEPVAAALAEWQPALPYRLSVQVGGRAPMGPVVHVRRASIESYGYSWGRRIVIADDVPERWLMMTVLHEVGHSLGLDHADADCADDERAVMVARARAGAGPVRRPAQCELERLAEMYGTEAS